jgi:hypothetical protein
MISSREQFEVSSRRPSCLTIRFGSIGDMVSAALFCVAQRDCGLVVSRNIISFLFGWTAGIDPHLSDFVAKKAGVQLEIGTLSSVVRSIRTGVVDSITLMPQSPSALSYRLAEVAIRVIAFALRCRVKVRRVYHGGQYYFQINERSQIVELLRSLPEAPRVSIFYDGKESAKSLSPWAIAIISQAILEFRPAAIISVFGVGPIDESSLPSTINNKTGRTNVKALPSIIEGTDFAVACDSGPMHMCSMLGIPTIVFMSGRHPLLAWTPLVRTNYYVFNDALSCIGCQKAECPLVENICVNSEYSLSKFHSIVREATLAVK